MSVLTAPWRTQNHVRAEKKSAFRHAPGPFLRAQTRSAAFRSPACAPFQGDPVTLDDHPPLREVLLGLEDAAVSDDHPGRSEVRLGAGEQDPIEPEGGRPMQRSPEDVRSVAASPRARPDAVADVAALAPEGRGESVTQVRDPDNLGPVPHEPVGRVRDEPQRYVQAPRRALEGCDEGPEIGRVQADRKGHRRLAGGPKFRNEPAVGRLESQRRRDKLEIIRHGWGHGKASGPGRRRESQ